MEEKHCTKCNNFCWWDGDFCCTTKMSIIEGAEDGKYWTILPDKFNANKCEDYDEREDYINEVHGYYLNYIQFIRDMIHDDDEFFKEDFLIHKYGYKHYESKKL